MSLNRNVCKQAHCTGRQLLWRLHTLHMPSQIIKDQSLLSLYVLYSETGRHSLRRIQTSRPDIFFFQRHYPPTKHLNCQRNDRFESGVTDAKRRTPSLSPSLANMLLGVVLLLLKGSVRDGAPGFMLQSASHQS